MKINATLRQINDSIPFFKELIYKDISYNVGYNLYIISEKLDKVIEYMRNRVLKETDGIDNVNEKNEIINKILDTKIEIDAEQIDRDIFFKAIPNDTSFPPAALATINFILTSTTSDEVFRVIE